MNYSLNLDLLEPTPGDQYNIDHFNQNAEILDEHIHNLEESSDALSQALNTGLSAEREAREAGDEASRQFANLQGVCPVAKGGTGSTTKQDAIDNLFSEIPQLLSVNNTDMFTFLRSGSVKKTTLDIFVRKLYELIKPMIGSPIETAMILPFASEFGTAQEPYKFVPEGFLACDGQAISRETYAKLFERTGIKYGSGDGITTFNVPDMRESVPKGIGENPKGASHVKAGGLTLGEFQDDRNKTHSHTMAHTHNMSHTHTRGNMDITGSMNFGYGSGTTGGYGANGAFYAADARYISAIGNAAESNPPRFDGVVFQASRTWSGTTSEPSNANTGGSSAANTGTDGGTTTEVKSVGVNYIIKY